MKNNLTRLERAGKPYVNIKDIRVILHCSHGKAKKIYDLAKRRMQPEIYEIHQSVELSTVLKILKINFNTLVSQIKSTQS